MTTVSQIFQSMDWGPAPESDKSALAWLAKYNHAFGHYVGGRFTEPIEDALFDVINPSNRQRLARVSQGSAEDVDAAVGAAREALSPWRGLAPHARARYLYALARAVQRNSRLLAV